MQSLYIALYIKAVYNFIYRGSVYKGFAYKGSTYRSFMYRGSAYKGFGYDRITITYRSTYGGPAYDDSTYGSTY